MLPDLTDQITVSKHVSRDLAPILGYTGVYFWAAFDSCGVIFKFPFS